MDGRRLLSLGKLTPGQEAYYVETVARGAEEYYAGAKEAPGQWMGAASEQLGLTGEVDAEALGRVLEHVHPNSTHRLTASRSVPVVAGFDVTFCAPKSVSLLFALGDPEVSNEVRNAADASVRASFQVLERAACRVRRGKGGHELLDADGFVAAGFRHRTSRAGDPHLHTHVVIANLAHSAVDGRWTALDARPLYSWLSPVGHLYEAQLRWELTARLGVEWGPVRNGIADVAGIPREAIREFSTRRREIEAHLEESGQHGARAAQLATYATRQPKRAVEAEGLLPGWRTRAQTCGLDAQRLVDVLDRATVLAPPTPGSPEAESLYAWLASADGLTARASAFGERDAIKAVCNALPHGGRVDDVLDLVEGFLTSEHVLALGDDRAGATIRLRDGTAVAARTGEGRWTTPEMLELEMSLIDSALCGQATGAGVAAPDAIEAAITARPTLSTEQRAMVRSICGSGDRVELVEGVAGAGKTFALGAAREAWQASGYRVIGCSLAARAARHLEEDAGIPAATIDRLLADVDRSGATGLNAWTVIVVDEAAMVGTRKLVRLCDCAAAARAKVVFVGDPCQLPEIDAGGAFRGLRTRLGAVELTENRRQSNEWERAALAELRAGNPDAAIDSYIDHDRIHVAASDHDARTQLVEDWMNARVEGEDVLMVAARLADVDDLNGRARAVLREEGYLDPDRVSCGSRAFTVGDEVLALRNDYRIGIFNGTRAVIDNVDPVRRAFIVTTDQREQLIIPFAYLEAGHLTHGYATTIHKAQGLTVDRCLVLLDDTSAREHTYTALSRGRQGNELYVSAQDHRFDERHAAEIDADGLETVRAVTARSAGQHFAFDQLRAPQSTLDELRSQREELSARLGFGPPDPSDRYNRLLHQQSRLQGYRDGAASRRDRAWEELDQLGPIGRRIHRADRRAIEDRISRFDDEIAGYEAQLDRASLGISELIEPMLTRSAWEYEHAPELQHLSDLDREITLARTLERFNERTIEHGIDHGLELGL